MSAEGVKTALCAPRGLGAGSDVSLFLSSQCPNRPGKLNGISSSSLGPKDRILQLRYGASAGNTDSVTRSNKFFRFCV